MTLARKRWRIAAAVLGLLLLAGLAALLSLPDRPKADRRDKPVLMLLTSLPVMFPERFTLERNRSPLLEALQRRYRVVPISIADAASLDAGSLLLMAQPRAQPGEALVDLDRWVRGGGRVLLLADPALQWPSELPLSDPARPPFAFADTGLLGHWGLRLIAPDRLGQGEVVLDGLKMKTRSPGRLATLGGDCSLRAGIIARCRVDHGKATVIADADFLDVRANDGPERTAKLAIILDELALLER